MLKSILGLIIALSLLSGVLIAFFTSSENKEEQSSSASINSQSQEKIEEIETNIYESKDLGLSFKYHKDLRFIDNNLENIDSGGHLQFFNYPQDKYVGGETVEAGDFKIEIITLKKNEKETLRDFVAGIVASGLNQDKSQIIQNEKVGEINWLTNNLEDGNDFKSFYTEINPSQSLVVTVYPFTQNLDELEMILTSIRID